MEYRASIPLRAVSGICFDYSIFFPFTPVKERDISGSFSHGTYKKAEGFTIGSSPLFHSGSVRTRSGELVYLLTTSSNRDSTTKTAALILVISASLASTVLALFLLK